MSDEACGATVAKRRLSRRLTELRRASGHTANHVCDLLDWGRGKVGRFEANHWKRPEMSDIRDLLRVYGVGEEERAELEELAIRARARPWWREYTTIFENEFPGFENDAVRIRQKILDRTDGTAPELIAVITEASLMYRWGTKPDRREQIMKLVELGARPNIQLRMQRFIEGPPTGRHSMVSIFTLPDPEPSIVYVETDSSIEEVTTPESVSNYVQSFARASDAALDPDDTTLYLKQLADQLE